MMQRATATGSRCGRLNDDGFQCVKRYDHDGMHAYAAGQRRDEPAPPSCTVQDVTPQGVQRCLYRGPHSRADHRFVRAEPFVDYCGWRRSNVTRRTTRYCALDAGHRGEHVYSIETEREMTRDEVLGRWQ